MSEQPLVTRCVFIIDPAMHTPEIDCFNHISRLSPCLTSYHLPALCGLESLNGLQKQIDNHKLTIAGIIVLGSASSVNDNIPWQTELARWLRPKIDAGIPFLGFCFGHQLLAHIYGGKVDFVRDDQSKLKGFDSVEIFNSRLFSDRSCTILRSHKEMVVNVPSDFRVIAKHPAVAIDGLEHDSLPVWSLQTHPEATAGFLLNQEMPNDAATVETFPEEDKRLSPGWRLVKAFLDRLA